jgi:hypothetical protein
MNKKKQPDDVRVVAVTWGSSEDLQTIYVNQLHLNHGGDEFYLTFGELPLPLFTDKSDIPEEMKIIPKVRLAIPPDAMERIAAAIKDNVKKYNQKKSKNNK